MGALLFSLIRVTNVKLINEKKCLKVNHPAYIEPRWCGSRISADCQQKLLFTKHDTRGRLLLVTFLEKQEHAEITFSLESVFVI